MLRGRGRSRTAVRGIPLVGGALLLLALAQAAEPPHVEDWKYDVVRLKNGRELRGLVEEETPRAVRFRYIKRSPGSPTVVFTTSFEPREVRQIERLSPEDRAGLAARIRALDRTGEGENALMEDLELRSVPWGKGGSGLSYTSDQFVLVSNAREAVVRRAAVRLEQIYAAYMRFLPPRYPAGKPTRILLVHSLAEYRELLRGQGQDLLNPALYDPARNEVVCASELEWLGDELERISKAHAERWKKLCESETEYRRFFKGAELARWLAPVLKTRKQIKEADRANEEAFQRATERLFRTLYHEAFHAYLATFVYPPAEAEVPRWLNEGLAQIFETAILEAGELRVGHADKDRLARVKAALRREELVPLPELLRSGARHFLVAHGTDQEVSNRYYLASWALAFHLMFEQRRLGTPELDVYVRAAKAGADPLEAFQKLVHQPLEEFEKAYHQYLLHLRSDGSVARPGEL